MGNRRKKGKRKYRRFGVAGGDKGLSARRKKRHLRNVVRDTLNTFNVQDESLSMCVKAKKDLKFTFARLSVRRAMRYIVSSNETDSIKLNIAAADGNDMPGNRILNLNGLKKHVSEISLHSALCEKAREKALRGIDPIVLISEKRNGLECILKCKCKGCGKEFVFNNSEVVESDSGQLKEINVKGVWGSMVTGGGASVLNELLGTLGIPGINTTQYTKTEEQIGEWWRVVLQEDMKEAGREERQHAIDTSSYHEGIPSIAVVCDGGWCKRSHKHTYNAMAGVAVIFGLHTKKLLHIGIRNKLCYICSTAQNRNEAPREHQCFKNWTDSAQAMESDIILEGFLNCEQEHGVRYMKVIADGDSSVYSSIVENVAGWGPYVEKIECANHACKCLRSHLEQLVVDKPYYKGKGKLTLLNRKRIVQGVRCAIKMRSKEKDITQAKKKLRDDIRNCARHVLGFHDKCSTDFCKHNVNLPNVNIPVIDGDGEKNIDEEEDAIRDVSEMWSDTMAELSQEDLNELRCGSSSQGKVNEDLLKDLFLILNRMANKSERLISNFTSNLAECWMNVRCKFDGGKVTNRCFRGSFYARCYGGGLRSSRGPAWSPMVYCKVTGHRADDVFVNTYRQRAKKYLRTVKRQRKPATKLNRFKRKMTKSKENDTKKAKRAYGPNILTDTPDLSSKEINSQCNEFYQTNVVVTPNETIAIELETKGQSVNERWKLERKKRLTSSVFGEVMSRGVNNNSPMLTKRLLYSNFGGNAFTRKGLMEEENTRKEYMNLKNQDKPEISHVTVPGLIISQEYPFLAASSDGIVTTTDGKSGLIEIKNLLQNKNTLIKEAAKKEKSFCLQCSTSGNVSLKRNHKFYFQIQGQLNILKKEWCDFVIRRTNPYDIFIERIEQDKQLWELKMVPKLKAFYFTHLLPEITLPRYRTVTGIRKPSIPWFQPSSTEKTCPDPHVQHLTIQQKETPTVQQPGSSSTPSLIVQTVSCKKSSTPQPRGKQKQEVKVSSESISSRPIVQHVKEARTTQLRGKQKHEVASTSTSSPILQTHETVSCVVPRTSQLREKRKQKIKFVGRRVCHKWENEDGGEQWYKGVVLGVINGKDGDENAVYQIQYRDELEPSEVDNIYKDFTEGNIRFDDI